MWEAAKDQTADQAIAVARGKFTWHFRHVEIAGIPIGGMTLLQIAPCFLPLLALLLIPTELTIDAPEGVTVKEIVWPPSTDLKQQGQDQPLAVF